MRNENVAFFGLSGSSFTIIGLLLMVFEKHIFSGLLIFLIGCLFNLSILNKFYKFDFTEIFFTITTFLGLILLLFFFIKGHSYNIVYMGLPLYTLNFLFFVFSFDEKKIVKNKKIKNKKNVKELSKKLDKINKKNDNSKRAFKEVEKIYEDLEELKTDIKNMIVDEHKKKDSQEFQPKFIVKKETKKREVKSKKEYLYVDGGKSFHLPGCIALSRTNKDKIKSFGQRSIAIRKGFKTCKACNS